MSQPEQLLTSPEVAKLIDKSARTVHRLVASGDLQPVKQLSGRNGAFLFSRADVERIAARFEKSAAA